MIFPQIITIIQYPAHFSPYCLCSPSTQQIPQLVPSEKPFLNEPIALINDNKISVNDITTPTFTDSLDSTLKPLPVLNKRKCVYSNKKTPHLKFKTEMIERPDVIYKVMLRDFRKFILRLRKSMGILQKNDSFLKATKTFAQNLITTHSLNVEENVLAFSLGTLIKPTQQFKEILQKVKTSSADSLDLLMVRKSSFLFCDVLDHFTLISIDRIFNNKGYAHLFQIYYEMLEE